MNRRACRTPLISLPELMLALGAMALLLLGVFAGDRHQAALTYLAVALLVVTGGLVVVTAEQRTGLQRRARRSTTSRASPRCSCSPAPRSC